MADNPIIVALDVPELDQAVELARRLEGEVGYFKVGLELFGGHGPAAVERIAAFGPVFLDLKLHDIPTTVERAARRLGRLGVAMLTVHATGGPGMVAAAVAGLADGARGTAGPTPIVLAVTVLTSMSDADLTSINMPGAADQVPALAAMAVGAGAPGLVCAPRDLARVRAAVGQDPVLVTPGIRPAGGTDDDHARAATPAQALAAGADHLVVGRPITRAADPVTAVRSIMSSLDG
jgi:orotidine-5'-phosphate decarboxylase